MSELLKAFLSSDPPSCLKKLGALNGILKLTDFGSDVLFIYTVWQYPSVFPNDDYNVMPLVIASTVFTAVGLLFDLYKIFHRWRIGKWEDDDDDRWENANLFFEEVPQFIVLTAFLANISHCDESQYIHYAREFDGYKEIECNAEQLAHDKEIIYATLISFCFTTYRVVLVSGRYIWSLCCRRNQGKQAKIAGDKLETKYVRQTV